jgi:zinc protease
MQQRIISNHLDNGLKVIVTEDHSHPLVSMQLYVRIGGFKETYETSGFSHFCEHLVFKSTEKYPENEIMTLVSELGGNINAYTDYDTTCFYITLPKENVAQGLDFLSQLVTAQCFSDKEFQAEKKVVLEELKQYQNDPLDYFVEAIPQHYFKESNFKRPIIGYSEVLKNSTPQQLRDYIADWYVPNNAFLVIAGDVSAENIKPAVNEYFGKWRSKPVPKDVMITEAFPEKPGFHVIKQKSEHDYLAIVFPELAETNERNHALSLVLKAFGYGKRSRLYKRLFHQDSLIDSLKIHSYCGIQDGISVLLVLPKQNASIERIIDIVKEETYKLFKMGLRPDEVEQEKKEVLFSYRYAFEYIESLALTLGSEEVNGDYHHFLNYPQMIKNITQEDIKSVIKEFLDPNIMQIYYSGKKEISKERVLAPIERPNTAMKNISKHPEFRQYELKNGCRVLMKKVKAKPTIGITAAFNVSQLYETPELRGTNLITATGMMYGNEKTAYEQMVKQCSASGINFSVSTSKETSSIKVKCFSETLPTAINMLADTVLTPLFPKKHIDNIKQTYISNISRIKDYPPQYSNYLWNELLLGKKSNLLSRTGTKADLKKVTIAKIKKWYEMFYHPSNMTICVVGDFDFDDVLYQIEHSFGNVPSKDVPLKRNLLRDETLPKYKRVNKNSDQSIIHIGGFGCDSQIPQQNTDFWVLSQIIGGDLNSRMFRKLREESGAAYSLNFDFFAIDEVGIFHAAAIVDKEMEKESRQQIMEIIEDIRLNGVTAQELEVTRKFLNGVRLMESESVLAQASTIASLDRLGYSYDYYLDRQKRLDNVTLESLHDLAKRYFAKENLYTLIYA